MATFNKINSFVQYLLQGVFNLAAAGDTVKVALTNTAPVATNTVFADLTEISAGNGYVAGGEDVQNDVSLSSGTASMTGVDVVWTASGGSIGPARYVVLYDDTPTSPADPLMGWWDYASEFTLADGESLTVDFGTSILDVA